MRVFGMPSKKFHFLLFLFTFLPFLPLPLLISDPIKSDLRMRVRKNGRQREVGTNERTNERAREASKRGHLQQGNGKEFWGAYVGAGGVANKFVIQPPTQKG